MIDYKPRLYLIYKKDILPLLIKKYNFKNYMNTPKLTSIILNVGLGDAVTNINIININKKCIEKICGQKAFTTKAKKSISTFKLRKDSLIGIKVTLRRNKMWEFLDRLINIAMPRIKDFKGVKSNFDGHGNVTIGIKEQMIFPELDYQDIDKVRGLNITITTSISSDQKAKFFLQNLGIPFNK